MGECSQMCSKISWLVAKLHHGHTTISMSKMPGDVPNRPILKNNIKPSA